MFDDGYFLGVRGLLGKVSCKLFVYNKKNKVDRLVVGFYLG